MNTKINEILQEIESVIVGKNEIVEKILMAILAQGHVLMEDVPGVGKTTTAMAFAKVLGLDTRRHHRLLGLRQEGRRICLQARRDHDESAAGG